MWKKLNSTCQWANAFWFLGQFVGIFILDTANPTVSNSKMINWTILMFFQFFFCFSSILWHNYMNLHTLYLGVCADYVDFGRFLGHHVSRWHCPLFENITKFEPIDHRRYVTPSMALKWRTLIKSISSCFDIKISRSFSLISLIKMIKLSKKYCNIPVGHLSSCYW